jgi:membrane protease YdiL (CAAX protease family)
MRALKAIGQIGLAILLGVLVASVGTLAWGILVTVNLKVGAGVPWSAVAMAGVLFLYWRYLAGAGWPAATRDLRARRLCATSVDRTTWWLALAAGAASALGLAALWTLLSRASAFEPNALPDLSRFPASFTAPLLVMGALVAPVCEEAGYRGYLQGALEERHAAAFAIGVSSLVFAAAHLTHGLVWEKQLVYLLGGIVWGTTAWLTRSILPGMVGHAATDVVFFTLVWPYDGTRTPLAPDVAALSCVAMIAGGTLVTLGAFMQLAARRR